MHKLGPVFIICILFLSPVPDVILKGFFMTTQLKERERRTLAKANDDVRAYVDEVVRRAPRFSAKQLDSVTEALNAKEVRNG